MKKYFIASILLVAFLFSASALVQARPDQQNPATDIERGVFVHYPHANGQARGGGSATGDQVNDSKYNGIHWAGLMPEIHYSVNPANEEGLLPEQVIGATELAFQEWMDENIKDSRYITFVYDGATTTNTPVSPSRDSANTVSFEPLSSTYSNAIAITFYWYYRGSKELVEADTVFNSDLSWSIGSVSDKYDLQNIATHEFGHWLVLGDLYSLRDSELTMYGYGALGETKKTTLGRGDITGINKIY
jgi:hypothetical protein